MTLSEEFILPLSGLRRPSDFFRAMQHAGEQHLAAAGYPMDAMLACGRSLMLSHAGVRFLQSDAAPDSVRTRMLGARGAHAERAFWFYRGSKPVAVAANRCFCIDLATRKVVRPNWPMPGAAAPAPIRLRRLTMPEPRAACGVRAIDDGCIDYNGHVNNAWYCDFALDALGGGVPREIQLQFMHEILPHTSVALFRTERSHVCGTQDAPGEPDRICFIASCEW